MKDEIKLAKCHACHSLQCDLFSEVKDYEYNINYLAQYFCCTECGTLNQHPMPSMDTLSEFYPKDYHSFSGKGLILKIKNTMRLKRLLKLVKNEKSIILDYGCGEGQFIKEAVKVTNDITFWGYEISSDKEKFISDCGRVIIIKGSFDDLMAEIPMCDLITMNHVIEHLPNPVSVLEALYKKLNDGGILEGQTPAADSLERKIFGAKWSGFHAPRHTIIYSQKGLKKILLRSKFNNSEIRAAFNPAGIAVSLASVSQIKKIRPITRKGLKWIIYMAIATALYPFDILSRAPGIINFYARKINNQPTSYS